MDEHKRASQVSREHLVEAREVTAAGIALCVYAAYAHRLDVVEVRNACCIHLSTSMWMMKELSLNQRR